jgi:hypothetical protein
VTEALVTSGKEAKEDIELRLGSWKEAGAGSKDDILCKELMEKNKQAWSAEGC